MTVGIALAAALLVVDRARLGASSPIGAAASMGPRPLPVIAAAVEPVEGYAVRRAYTGELRPRRSSELGWEAPGRVLAVYVDEGDRVHEGQALAELEGERAAAELDGLRAQHARAAALLAELEAGPRAQTIEVARAELRSLTDRLELAEQRHARREQLVAGEFVTADELDVTATAVETTRADREAARQRLDELEEGTRAEDLSQQRAAVAELDARIARAEVDLADRVLRAPFDAVITRRSLDEGAVVDAGRTVLALIERDALEARIGVPVARAGRLRRGQTVELEVRGAPVRATIRALVPELDGPTRTTDLVIDVEPDDARQLFPGEVARLFLDEEIDAAGTWVPTAALVRGARGLWAAFALVPDADDPEVDVVERRELEVLHTTGERALVRGTIARGDRLVVEGVHRVVPGQRVAAQLN